MNASRQGSKVPAIIVLWALIFGGCMALGSGPLSREDKLRAILDADLLTMADEVRAKSPEAVLRSPYYRVLEYKATQEGKTFKQKAVVEFFYFDAIRTKQVRKYRYNEDNRRWERWAKEIQFNLSGVG